MKKKLCLLMVMVLCFAAAGCGEISSSEFNDALDKIEKLTDENADLRARLELRDEQYKILNEKYEDCIKELNGDMDNIENENGKWDYLFLRDDMRWNMALGEVKDKENKVQDTLHSLENKNPAYLVYEITDDMYNYAFDVDSVYCFIDNKLKAYWCKFDRESPNIKNYKKLYEEIKGVIADKYGECNAEDFIWTDDTYKNDESQWNNAFRYGYVTIETTWDMEGFVVIIRWSYEDGLNVITSSPDNVQQL